MNYIKKRRMYEIASKLVTDIPRISECKYRFKLGAEELHGSNQYGTFRLQRKDDFISLKVQILEDDEDDDSHWSNRYEEFSLSQLR